MVPATRSVTRRALGLGLALAIGACRGAGADTQSATAAKSGAAFPPGYTTTLTGDMHDFDYFEGAWTIDQRRLAARGVGSTEWNELPGILCMSLYLDGIATVDELYFPTTGASGLTLRTFDAERGQWLIYWVSSTNGKLGPPVIGGFDGNRGEFYGEDHDGDRPVKVRFIWTKIDHDHARWEQAFSYDDRTWETNWTADFVRADRATLCEVGRPKRRTAG